jgi:hypothetical protein
MGDVQVNVQRYLVPMAHAVYSLHVKLKSYAIIGTCKSL